LGNENIFTPGLVFLQKLSYITGMMIQVVKNPSNNKPNAKFGGCAACSSMKGI
jgi:hypothetical protein